MGTLSLTEHSKHSKIIHSKATAPEDEQTNIVDAVSTDFDVPVDNQPEKYNADNSDSLHFNLESSEPYEQEVFKDNLNLRQSTGVHHPVLSHAANDSPATHTVRAVHAINDEDVTNPAMNTLDLFQANTISQSNQQPGAPFEGRVFYNPTNKLQEKSTEDSGHDNRQAETKNHTLLQESFTGEINFKDNQHSFAIVDSAEDVTSSADKNTVDEVQTRLSYDPYMIIQHPSTLQNRRFSHPPPVKKIPSLACTFSC